MVLHVSGCLAMVLRIRENLRKRMHKSGSRSLGCLANSKIRDGERVLECVPITLAIWVRSLLHSYFETGAASHP